MTANCLYNIKFYSTYTYTTNIVGEQFQMIVTIQNSGIINIQVIDFASNEYGLHRITDVCGPFVSLVRTNYENILTK